MGGQHSNCARPRSKCYLPESPKAAVVRVSPPELTSKQKLILRTSWDQMERDIATVGIITFVGMFKTHPQVQDYFLPFAGLAKTDGQYSATLRQHALRVMATVEKCIHRLDEPERMVNILEQLGSRHINYNAKIDYVDLLGCQFVMAVKENSSAWSSDLENAWLSLVRHITFHIKKGWMDRQELQATREASRVELGHKKNRLTSSASVPASARPQPRGSKDLGTAGAGGKGNASGGSLKSQHRPSKDFGIAAESETAATGGKLNASGGSIKSQHRPSKDFGTAARGGMEKGKGGASEEASKGEGASKIFGAGDGGAGGTAAIGEIGNATGGSFTSQNRLSDDVGTAGGVGEVKGSASAAPDKDASKDLGPGEGGEAAIGGTGHATGDEGSVTSQHRFSNDVGTEAGGVGGVTESVSAPKEKDASKESERAAATEGKGDAIIGSFTSQQRLSKDFGTAGSGAERGSGGAPKDKDSSNTIGTIAAVASVGEVRGNGGAPKDVYASNGLDTITAAGEVKGNTRSSEDANKDVEPVAVDEVNVSVSVLNKDASKDIGTGDVDEVKGSVSAPKDTDASKGYGTTAVKLGTSVMDDENGSVGAPEDAPNGVGTSTVGEDKGSVSVSKDFGTAAATEVKDNVRCC